MDFPHEGIRDVSDVGRYWRLPPCVSGRASWRAVDGPGVWDNWAAFAADNPSYRVAKKDIPFIIADVEGDYHVYDFQFG
jgi:hypothetical protein